MANQQYTTCKWIFLMLLPLLQPLPHLLLTDAWQIQRSAVSFRHMVDITTTTRSKRPLHYCDHYWKRSTRIHHRKHFQRRHTMILRALFGSDTSPIDEASRISMVQQGQNTSVRKNTTDVNLPKHIAFVCDGNTRWAKQRQQPTLMGHFMGANRTVELIQTIRQQSSSSSSSLSSSSIHHHDITHMTFFAFSTENWNRPMSEIRNLFNILEQTAHYWYNTLQHEEQEQQRHQQNRINQFSNSNTQHYNNRNIIIKFIGDLDDPRIPNNLRIILYKLQECTLSRCSSTADVTIKPLTICIAINYGGRHDIVRASQRLMIKLLREKNNSTSATAATTISEDDIRQHITEANLQSCFDTHDIPDPDLFIRTSGEVRLSNFLLWNVAYTELYFTNIYWPDFTMEELDNALVWYSQRKRRFGGNVERIEK